MIKKLRYPVIILILIVDQLVKYLIRANMDPGQSVPALGKLMSITYIQNRGAAFSILNGEGLALIIITSVAMAVLVIVMEVYRDEAPLLVLSIAMMVGGGVGNLIDRAVFGFVTDMFDFHFWPVFNVADIFVVAGCLLLCVHILKGDGSSDGKRLK